MMLGSPKAMISPQDSWVRFLPALGQSPFGRHAWYCHRGEGEQSCPPAAAQPELLAGLRGAAALAVLGSPRCFFPLCKSPARPWVCLAAVPCMHQPHHLQMTVVSLVPAGLGLHEGCGSGKWLQLAVPTISQASGSLS